MSTSKQAMLNASTNFSELGVRFSDAMDVGQMKSNLIKMLENHRQRAEDIKINVQRMTSGTVNQAELIPALVAQLREIQEIEQADTSLAQSIQSIHNDLFQYKNSIGNKNRQPTVEFTLKDILYVSNATIVETFDRYFQKSPGLYRIWVTNVYPRLTEIFVHWPEFKRVSEKHKLFIPTPANATDTYLSSPVVDSRFFETTARSNSAISEFEKQLGIVLNSFFSLNSVELTKSQLDCLKKYKPPFGYVNDIADNIFFQNLTQATDTSAKNNLRLFLAAGGEDTVYTSVMVTPNNTFAVELSGNSCGCRNIKPRGGTNSAFMLVNGIDDQDYFSLGCGQRRKRKLETAWTIVAWTVEFEEESKESVVQQKVKIIDCTWR